MKNLSDRANGRFIFNDVVCGIDNVGDDSRDGSILKFERREKLTVLPCTIDIKDGIITFVINKPNRHEGNLYFRVLIKLHRGSSLPVPFDTFPIHTRYIPDTYPIHTYIP